MQMAILEMPQMAQNGPISNNFLFGWLRGHRGSRLQSRGKRTNRLNYAFSKLSDDTLTSGKESNVRGLDFLEACSYDFSRRNRLAVGLKLGRHSLR